MSATMVMMKFVANYVLKDVWYRAACDMSSNECIALHDIKLNYVHNYF